MAKRAIDVTAKVSSKGQITIPKAVRDELGLEEGTTVRFEGNRSGMRIVSTRSRKSFKDFAGWGLPGIPKGMNGVDWVRSLRGGLIFPCRVSSIQKYLFVRQELVLLIFLDDG